jgi:Ice-binding-like
MNRFETMTKPLTWFAALLLVAAVAACGGGGSSGGGAAKGVNNPAPTSPGAGTGTGVAGGHGPLPVNLLSILTNNFVILTKAGVTNVHASAITGNIGSSPITAAAMDNVFCSEMTGTIYGVDAAYVGSGDQTCFLGGGVNKTLVDNAVLDMGTAYTDAAGRAADFTEVGAGNISGMTLPAGTYKWGTGVSIVTDVTLSGGANDVWIFQVAQGVTQSSGAQVKLIGGALAKNVFWQSFGVVDVGTTAVMNGVVLSQTSISLKTGASATGRLLAQTQVTLQSNAVTSPP